MIVRFTKLRKKKEKKKSSQSTNIFDIFAGRYRRFAIMDNFDIADIRISHTLASSARTIAWIFSVLPADTEKFNLFGDGDNYSSNKSVLPSLQATAIKTGCGPEPKVTDGFWLCGRKFNTLECAHLN